MQADTPHMPVNRGTFRTFYFWLSILVLAACIFAGGYLYMASIDKRLGLLEAATDRQTAELAEMRERLFSSALQEGRYESLNARMAALTKAFVSLDSKLTQRVADYVAGSAAPPAGVRPVTVVASPGSHPQAAAPPGQTAARANAPLSAPGAGAGEPAAGKPAQGRATLAGAVPPLPATAVKGPASGAGRTPAAPPADAAPAASRLAALELPDTPTAAGKPGPWVINLLSSRDKGYAETAAARARALGYEVEINSAEVKGRTYWRVQLPGFSSLRAARAGAVPVREKLALEEVWLLKR